MFQQPLTQVTLLGLVCLCCPGMFNALMGLGAGGSMSSNIALTDAANGALYGCFAIVGFFAGSITNMVGVKTTLTVGSIGYALYASAFWIYDRHQVDSVVVAAGAILGCCAGIFWSAQGAVMMSYPEERHKGKYVAIFWTLFNLGGIVGSVIALALNLENHQGGVSTGTYTAFVAIMLLGVLLSLTLLPPCRVQRADGSHVAVAAAANWKSELKGVVLILREWRILALTPAFLASNWPYAYQFRVNAVYFDAPDRALNDTMYWAMQIFASVMLGLWLDYQRFPRRLRGLYGLGAMFIILMVVWSGGFAFQLSFGNHVDHTTHWTNPSSFAGPFVLYMFYGFADALYQTYLYWLMGAMSNDPSLLARYAGYYKAVQSAGAAISFGIDAVDIPLRWECLICWIILFVSFPLMLLVANGVSDTNDLVIDNESFYDEKHSVDTKEHAIISSSPHIDKGSQQPTS